jgi:hypothetical protein
MSKDSSVLRKSMYMQVPVYHDGTEGNMYSYSTCTVHPEKRERESLVAATARMALAWGPSLR